MVSARSIDAALVLALTLGTSIAHGQGCVRGDRETTAAERQTMTSNLERTLAALPGAPEGWVIGGYEGISVVQSLCIEYEDTPFAYGISRIYNRADDVDLREQSLAEAGAALRARQEQRQPRIDALMARAQELGTALGEAAQNGDEARIEAINQQLEELQQEMDAVLNEGPTEEQLATIAAITYQDREMSISVAVNAAAITTDGMQSAAAPAGALDAFRGEETREGVTTAEVIALFGGWEPRAEGSGMQTVRRGTQSSAAAHSVAVTVRADPARIDSLLATIGFGALAELLP